jgi:hypothetical protein
MMEKLQLAIFPKGYSGHRSINIRPIVFVQRSRHVFCHQICNGSDVKAVEYSKCQIVDHTSAKHQLAWCCLQCCVIGASNSLVTMKLIEGSNRLEYLLVLLDLYDYFPSQMI